MKDGSKSAEGYAAQNREKKSSNAQLQEDEQYDQHNHSSSRVTALLLR